VGGGESDRRSWPSAAFDRRAFLRRTGQAGVAAGVLGWSRPRVRSVDAQAAAGSPPPSESTTTPTVLGEPITLPDGSTPNVVLPAVVEAPSSGGGGLAFTGAELRQMAAVGGVAVGVGEAVRREGMRKWRQVEAEAESEAEAEAEAECWVTDVPVQPLELLPQLLPELPPEPA
jgi:hypothetical protein